MSERCDFSKSAPESLGKPETLENLYVDALDQLIKGGPKLDEFRAAMKWLNGDEVSDTCRRTFSETLPDGGLLSDDILVNEIDGRILLETLVDK
ncbi:MAG: hypothetical protein IT343_02760 [Candidatus Melainabacteria bacterium]|nr:hypothetical protein [Candidatus Melainabacteria bacterium]